MLEKLLSYVRKAKHGSIGAAVGSGSLLFGLGFTLVQAIGGAGSPEVFLGLLAIAAVGGSVVHGVLVATELRRLATEKSAPPVPELRARLEEAIGQLPPGTVGAVRGIVGDFEKTIRTLHRRLDRPGIPREPVIIEGGQLRIGEAEILVDTFYIDPVPVTNLQFAEFAEAESGWTGDAVYKTYGIPYFLCEFHGTDAPQDRWDHPVVWINWYAAVAFCNWRSLADGCREIYRFQSPTEVFADLSQDGWRLPTEAEWQMAARAGERKDHPWGEAVSPLKANYGNYYRGTTAVGRFAANDAGLFDMLGNVKEWCHDWYSELPLRGRENPTGPETGSFRIFRGASWMDPPACLTFGRRGKLPPQNTNPDLGFRCVRRPRRF